ncbi:MAG: flagellin [Oligoflexales bacterium]|nr:flagellin [Oligoflexales bacterium]
MGLRIRTNTTSLNAQNNLARSTEALKDSMTKISSGSRINRSADDAAGLAVSENLRADLRSLAMAKRNAMDGVSLVQTAEGGLNEAGNMLIRLRELAVQGASDTIGNKEREYLDMEFVQLKNEIDRIAGSTEFNGTYLLIGSNPVFKEAASRANKPPLEIQVGKDYYRNMDGPKATNPLNVIRMDLSRLNTFTDGDSSLGIGKAEEGTRVNRKELAQQSISVLDNAITKVSSDRAYLGSLQNRLGSTISNLGTQSENLSEAQSRIRDTDFATETANLTKASILQQAGTSILATANAQPQIALSLLKG